ncbi:MAG: ABC transporter permease [Thermoleophilia bacterium]
MGRLSIKGGIPETPGFRAGRFLALAVLVVLVVVPLLALLWRGMRPELLPTLAEPDVRSATVNSLITGSLAALLATVFGVGLSWTLERTDVPARNFFRAVFFMPLLIPPFIGTIGWLAVLGPVGYVNVLYNRVMGSSDGLINLYGPGGIVALLALHVYPIVYLMVAAALRGVPGALEEAARASGAGRLRVALDVTLPLIFPAILAGFTLTFMFNLSDFGIPALLGTPVQYTVLPTLIYSYLVNGTTDNPLSAASFLGILLLVLAGGAFLIQHRLTRRLDIDGAASLPHPVALGAARYPVTVLLGLLAAVFAVAPVLALLTSSLLKAPGVPFTLENLTLDNIQQALVAPTTVRGFVNSLLLASGAAVLAGLLGTFTATLITRTRSLINPALDALAIAPKALPGTVVAVAWILIGIPAGLYSTRAIILFAYVTAFIALMVQAVRGPLASVPVVLEDAARLSGASSLRTLRDVTWPLVSPAVFVGLGLVFFTAIREITISALLVAPGTETLGVVIFNLQEAGDYNAATSLALVVAVGGLTGVGAIVLLTRGKGIYGAG